MQLFNHNFVFSGQPRYRLQRHGLFWSMAWLYCTVLYGFLPMSIWLEKGVPVGRALVRSYVVSGIEAFLFLPSHMFLAYGIIYVLFPRYLNPSRYLHLVFGILILMVLTSVLSTVTVQWIVAPLRLIMGTGRTQGIFFYSMMAGLRGATTFAGFATAIKLAKIWYMKQEAYQEIEREKLHAELQLLKSQVHPHFLFNTLNNLYSLTLQRSDQSPAVVLKLSELLRYMLYECNAVEVPLSKEITFLKNYIALEQLRYGSRLDMSVSITGDWPRKQIAPLLLIPFLENAFKHGTSQQLEQAWMHLDLNVQGSTLKFKLINSYDTDQQRPAEVGGIGLQNVQKRLSLLYPGRHELRTVVEEETFMVILTLELTDRLRASSPLVVVSGEQEVA